MRVARSGLRAFVDAEHREFLFRRYVSKGNAFQPNTYTEADRYPFEFDFVRDHLGTDSAARLLSFGCSSGEEVFAMRERMPNAEIHGIDINARAIRLASGKLAERGGDSLIRFSVAESLAGEADGAYDAITCMAVLRDCRANELERCDRYIRFDDFARTIADFARCLKPGGLLAIGHSNFRVQDTPSATLFEELASTPVKSHTRMFGPDNRVLPDALPAKVIYRRV